VLCAGVEVKVTDRRAYDPIRTGVAMLAEAHRYPSFGWRADAWDPQRPYWIDKLTGSPRMREQINAGASTDEVVGAWTAELADFDRRRQQYLIYRGPRA
jgi:uncharacterized protein YbbC (DUF1343 family)